MVYELALVPIADQVDWVGTMFIPLVSPSFEKRVGRPKKLRNVDPNEKLFKAPTKMKRQQTNVKCSKCGKAGHNKRACKNAANAANEEGVTSNADHQPEEGVTSETPPSVVTPKQIPIRGRGRVRVVEASGSNLNTSRLISNALVDEDDSEFEALLSQANSGMIQGPTSWEQLGRTTNVPDSNKQAFMDVASCGHRRF